MEVLFKGNIEDLPKEYKGQIVAYYNKLVDNSRQANLQWFPEKGNKHLYHKITESLEQCDYFHGNAYLSQYVEDCDEDYKKEVVWQYFGVDDCKFTFYFQSKIDVRWHSQYGDIYAPTDKVKILK